jgi:chromosome segregation ATPase
MPTQPVIEKLEKLQVELDTVSFAVKHIDEAAKVAKTSADILKNISGLLAELKSVEEIHRKNLQKDFKEKIDSIEKQLQSMMSDLKDKTKPLNQLIDDTKKLEKSITAYFEELQKISFPERLDKIDNQISAINLWVANLQSFIQGIQAKIEKGFEDTNQNVKSGFSSIHDNIKYSQEKVTSDLASLTNAKTTDIIKQLTELNQLLKKEVKTNRIIQIVGFTIELIILFYLVTKI